MKPSQRLAELGMTLPPPAAPIGSYVPAARVGSFVYTSGQLPLRDGKIVRAGKVPGDVTIADAAEGARLAALNAVAAIAGVAGGVDNIVRIVRIGVYVNSGAGFTEQPKVANGASDLLFQIFGEAGRHARASVGVAELPVNAAVEIEVMAEVESPATAR